MEHQTPVLNKDLLKSQLRVVALDLPVKSTHLLVKKLNAVLFKRPDIDVSYVVKLPERKDRTILLLNEKVTSDLSQLSNEERAAVSSTEDVHVIEHVIELHFDNLSVEAILKRLLPQETELTTKYERIGHIAHLNLRREHLPYKHLIGQVILEKHSTELRTVVNKTSSIQDEYRTLPMELIAGTPEYQVVVREGKCQYAFDFRTVFWNSRLENEHLRLVHLVREGDVLIDMFAGVGPYALPAAKRGAQVWANDLNPHCYAALVHNAPLNLNARKQALFHAYNMDARDFMRHLFQGPNCAWYTHIQPFMKHYAQPSQNAVKHNKPRASPAQPPRIHIAMNLPGSAAEFLDVFRGLLPSECPLPIIHCYHFAHQSSEREDLATLTRTAITTHLGAAQSIELHVVRYTAANTTEYCATVVPDPSIAYQPSVQQQ